MRIHVQIYYARNKDLWPDQWSHGLDAEEILNLMISCSDINADKLEEIKNMCNENYLRRD